MQAKNLIFTIAFFSALTLHAPSSFALADYEITNLGSLELSEDGSFYSLNDSREVAGSSHLEAFQWSQGLLNPLPALDGTYSYAHDINNNSVIVGVSENGIAYLDEDTGLVVGGSAPTMWVNGIPTDLGVGGGGFNLATGINDSNQVVGWTNAYGDRSFLWQNGSAVDLLGPSVSGFNRANAINNSGQVIGTMNYQGQVFEGDAFIWQNGILTDFGSLISGSSIGQDINNSGYAIINSDGRTFLWDGTDVADIYPWDATVGGAISHFMFSTAISDSGLIVGNATEIDLGSGGPIVFGPFVNDYAFVLENGQLINLNDLLPENSGWLLEEAHDINAEGEIVGWGYKDGTPSGFLLQVVPEPVSSLLALIGGGVMLLRRRQGLSMQKETK